MHPTYISIHLEASFEPASFLTLVFTILGSPDGPNLRLKMVCQESKCGPSDPKPDYTANAPLQEDASPVGIPYASWLAHATVNRL